MLKDKQCVLELVFKLCFLLYTMLSVCNFTYGKVIISYIMWPMMVLGLIVFMWRIFHLKDYIKMVGVWFLIGLCISSVLSLIINFRYGLKENIVTFVLWIFYFFILYTRKNDEDLESVKKEFKIISCVYMVYVFLGNFVSLLLMILGYSHVYTNEKNYEVAAGFIWGRLWGVYIDPNFAAVMSVVAICLAWYYFKESKSRRRKVILVIASLISLLYIAFSDSRTGRVCLAVLCLTYGLLLLFKYGQELSINKKIVRIILLLFISIISFYTPKIITNAYNYMWSIRSEITHEEFEDKQIDRGYDVESDISNRRFDIWKSGIEILETSPVFGVSFGGMREYAKENIPETYIVNNDYKEFSTLDNEVLNIFVGQGLIGGIFFIVYVMIVLVNILMNIKKMDGENFALVSLGVTILVCIAASAMFRAAMFYHNSPNANVFWSFLGIVVYVCTSEERMLKNAKRN